MDTALQVFNYNGQYQIRTTLIDGVPWFVGKDIATVLGHSNPQKAIRNHVDKEDKKVNKTFTLGQGSAPVLINESGMYSLIFASKLATAKQFKHWVTSEVLPSIRRSGMYLTDKAADAYLNDPELFRQMAERCSALENKVVELEQELKKRYSFSVLGEIVIAQPGSITFKEGAAFLSQHGVKIGQNRLFAFCRDAKLLCCRKGKQRNKPTQKAVEAGLLNVQISGGFNTITMITPKGLKYLTDVLVANEFPLLVLIEEQCEKPSRRH